MPVEAKSLAAEESANGMPGDAASREAVLEQLGRLLASPHFKHSKHYPALLRHVVELTLDVKTSTLKERALGVDVFGRSPDYDTNLDPVVRTCACEVRKRLAHYYQEPGHDAELRIDLPPGSYHAEFHMPAAALAPMPVAAPAEPPPARSRRSPWWILIAAGLVPLALAIGAMNLRPHRDPVDEFWAPVLASHDTLMIALGRPRSEANAPVTAAEVMHEDSVAFADALSMARITGLVRTRNKRFDVRRTTSFTLNDLRKSPVILIGGFNNPWTLRLDEHLRFYFEIDKASSSHVIRDRRNAKRIISRGPDSQPYANVKEDYAIVARYRDPLTEEFVVTVAGIGKDGTLAAGEFVTEPQYLEALDLRIGGDWQHRNLQVVLATEIVNGIPGPPRVVDHEIW